MSWRRRGADPEGRPGGRHSAIILLLAASHTHSGPAGLSSKLHPASTEQIDHALRKRFVDVCAGVIARAREQRVPATVSIGQAPTTGLASNRNDPDGPYDPTVTVLSVQAESGSHLAVAVRPLPPHNAWGGKPAHLSRLPRLARANSEAISLRLQRRSFISTAQPAYGTRFTRKDQTPDEVDRIGSALAKAAFRALSRGTTRGDDRSVDGDRAATRVEPGTDRCNDWRARRASEGRGNPDRRHDPAVDHSRPGPRHVAGARGVALPTAAKIVAIGRVEAGRLADGGSAR